MTGTTALSVEAVAAELDVSTATIRAAIRSKTLHAVWVGNTARVLRRDLDLWVQAGGCRRLRQAMAAPALSAEES